MHAKKVVNYKFSYKQGTKRLKKQKNRHQGCIMALVGFNISIKMTQERRSHIFIGIDKVNATESLQPSILKFILGKGDGTPT